MAFRSFAKVAAICLFASLAGDTPATTAAVPDEQKPFPDYGFLPDGYKGKVFRLSQDYPKDEPGRSRVPGFFKREIGDNAEWMKYLDEQWKSYLIAARDYCFEGNIKADFRVEENRSRPWYHMPWQHYGRKGREGIHGMTKEAEVKPFQLASTQGYKGGQTYAVAFYNEFGGYTIGKVWTDHNRPDLKGTAFPHGSVIFKLLFVDVPTDQVPSLVNPVVWEGYITEAYRSEVRRVRPLALIQMDIMVRDDRAPTGWLFGTFQYNGKKGSEDPWANLVPVGIQWGNDPEVMAVRPSTRRPGEPYKTFINEDLKETRINRDAELPPTHLGWNGRLNGPVDNPRSSCMSCHATAQYPQKTEMSPTFIKVDRPKVGDERWMRWFQNYKCIGLGGKPFDSGEGRESSDFSLQLAMSLQYFHDWRDSQSGKFAEDAGEKQQVEIRRDKEDAEEPEERVGPLAPAPLARAVAARRETAYPHLKMGNPSDARDDGQDKDDFLMKKPFFALSYNNANGTPNWVSWRLTKAEIGNMGRPRAFKPDTELPAGFTRIVHKDYSHSGFNRGHMCPHSDRNATTELNRSTFITTNIVPQSSENNQGAWNQLEIYLRDLVLNQGKICYIIAGPHGKGGFGDHGLRSTIADGKVTVPAKTWKVILVLDEDVNDASELTQETLMRLIAVVMPNDQSVGLDWAKYRTSVDELEKLTGFKFFGQVPEEIIGDLKLEKDQVPVLPPVPPIHGGGGGEND